jgi:hypothetical protein
MRTLEEMSRVYLALCRGADPDELLEEMSDR